MKRTLIIVMVALLLLLAIGCSAGDSKGSDLVRITHKNYTEQRLTGQLLSVYLESKGFETTVDELAGTMLCFNALKNENVDVYAEFTGSAYGAVLHQTEILGTQETYDYVKKECEEQFGITWLKPLGWNNTYVMSVKPETQEKYGLKTLSDLTAVSGELILGTDTEFPNRQDGLIGLKEAYEGLAFKEVKSMDQGLTYGALNNDEIDVNTSYSTDGRIAKYGFVNLEDDKNFFPPYYVTPIIRMDYAEANPEVIKALEELGGHWNEEEMQKYNLSVDEGADARDVATQMLKDKGLIE